MKWRTKNAPETNLWVLTENNKRKNKDDKHVAVMHHSGIEGRVAVSHSDIRLKKDGFFIHCLCVGEKDRAAYSFFC